MDYKVLIDKYFSGITSLQDEIELRRCLMQDNLPADMLQERECLLAMLQPAEYDCCEAMDTVLAMIDNLAAEETAAIVQRQASRRVFLRYFGFIVPVAAAMLLSFLFFPYSSETVQDNETLVTVTSVDEKRVYESVIENNYTNAVAQNTVASSETILVDNVKEEHIYRELDAPPIHYVAQSSVEPKNAENGRFGGNILAEPPIVPRSVAAIMGLEKDAALYLLNIYSIMEYLRYMHDNDMYCNFSDMTRGVESMATGQPYAPHIEKLIDSRANSESLGDVQLLALDSIEFAPDDVPWNPAAPLRVYRIRSNGRETIVTFLYSICFDSQYVGLSSRAYAVDDESGDVYNVLGYKGCYTMDKRLVVSGCKGRNVLISLRFQKLKRCVKSISIHDSASMNSTLQTDPDGTVIASGVNVNDFR